MGLVAAVDFTLGAATLLGLLSSSSAAVAAAGVSKECPEGNGFFPDDLYCDVYYECSNGVGSSGIYDINFFRYLLCHEFEPPWAPLIR